MRKIVWLVIASLCAAGAAPAAPPSMLGGQSHSVGAPSVAGQQKRGLGLLNWGADRPGTGSQSVSQELSQPWAPPQPSTWDRMRSAVTDNPVTRTLGGGSNSTKADKPDDLLSLDKPLPQFSPEAMINIARLSEMSGRVDEARSHLERAAAQAPKDPSPLREIGRLEDRQGRFEAAESAYNRALAIAPADGRLHNDLGLCYARSGRLEQAAGTLGRAIELDPTKTLYRNNLATVLIELDRPDEALSQLLAVHAPASAHHNLAHLLARRGKMSEAALHWRSALECDPTFEPARLAMARVVPDAEPLVAAIAPVEPPSTPLSFAPQQQVAPIEARVAPVVEVPAEEISVATGPMLPRLLPATSAR